jgi:hypothetical protein
LALGACRDFFAAPPALTPATHDVESASSKRHWFYALLTALALFYQRMEVGAILQLSSVTIDLALFSVDSFLVWVGQQPRHLHHYFPITH